MEPDQLGIKVNLLQQLEREHLRIKLLKLQSLKRHFSIQQIQLGSILNAQRPYKRLRCSGGGENSFVMSFIEGDHGGSGGARFPDTVLHTVFGYIKDQGTLLNTRLVCHQWNDTIKNTGQLMTRLNFTIWHPKLFLDLQIANQIKSIALKHGFISNSMYLAFLGVISKTVRKVTFDYELDENSILNQQKNFLDILEKCSELQELKIIGNNKELFKASCGEDFTIAAGNCIKKFSIKPDNLINAEECGGISKILKKLPNSAYLEIFLPASLEVGKLILKAVLEYIAMHSKTSTTALKEICVETTGMEGRSTDFNTLVLKIALAAGENGINFITPKIDLWALLKLELINNEKEEHCINALTCRTIKQGILPFIGHDQLPNLSRLQACTNLKNLHLYFKRNLIQGEVIFLKHLPTLEKLILTCSDNVRFNVESISQLDQVLSVGLPSIKQLAILNDGFGSYFGLNWNRYFSNLEILILEKMKITPSNIFIAFSSLESLKRLYLSDLTELKDEAFTMLCKKDEIEIPAFGLFKMLKGLWIKNCPKLTKKCIVDGISKSTTLLQLSLGMPTNLLHDLNDDEKLLIKFRTILEVRFNINHCRVQRNGNF